MECNYFLTNEKNVTAVVTGVYIGGNSMVRVLSGYAFDKKNKPGDFWSMVNKKFIKELVKKYDLTEV